MKFLNNKKGMELSINMIVIMILGISMLGLGINMFYQAYNKTFEIAEGVDTQTQNKLNALMDDGGVIVIPFPDVKGERNDYVDFAMGINNELNAEKQFWVHVFYGGYVGKDETFDNEFKGFDGIKPGFNRGAPGTPFCGATNYDKYTCGDKWVLMPDTFFTLKNNDRESIPIRIVIPKYVMIDGDKRNLPKGQYIFYVDVCHSPPGTTNDNKYCLFGNDNLFSNRVGARQQLTITI